MDLILSIPEVLGRKLLTDWLQLRSLTMLDRAYLSHNGRDQLLLLLQGKLDLHVETRSDISTLGICRWLTKRAIIISGITLPLHGSNILLDRFRPFAERCGPNLTTIKFRNANRLGSNIANLMIPLSPNLQEISFNSGPNRLQLDLLKTVAACCPQLHTLSFPDCTGEWADGLNVVHDLSLLSVQTILLGRLTVPSKFWATLVTSTPQLQRLVLNCGHFPMQDPLLHVWKNLRCLEATNFLHTKALVSMLKNNHQLTSITLNCRNYIIVDDYVLRCIAAHCKELTKLSIQSKICSDAGMCIMLRQCTKLTHLNINGNNHCTTKTCQAIVENCKDIAYLNIKACYVTIAVLAQICEECTHLKEIHYSPHVLTGQLADYQAMRAAFVEKGIIVREDSRPFVEDGEEEEEEEEDGDSENDCDKNDFYTNYYAMQDDPENAPYIDIDYGMSDECYYY